MVSITESKPGMPRCGVVWGHGLCGKKHEWTSDLAQLLSPRLTFIKAWVPSSALHKLDPGGAHF